MTDHAAITAVEHRVERYITDLMGLSPTIAAACRPALKILHSPPRIVVLGRVKSGKSTLVNALIGAPVSETGVLETTNMVRMFHYGAPDRAVVTLHNGQQHSLPTTAITRTTIPYPAHEITWVERFMPIATLRDYTLIDTPGLFTVNSASHTRTEEAIERGITQSRRASVHADAALLLLDVNERADELALLADLSFTPLSTLGILSRADMIGTAALGEIDPISQAQQCATSLAHTLSHQLATIIPVAGLLAETGHTGALTEHITQQLATYTQRDDLELLEHLLGNSATHQPATSSTSAQQAAGSIQQLHTLVDKLGIYGLLRGRHIAPQGAAALSTWLCQQSQFDRLTATIETQLLPVARLHRAQRARDLLRQLPYQFPAQRSSIQTLQRQLTSSAEALPLAIFDTYQSLASQQPTSPVVTLATTILRSKLHLFTPDTSQHFADADTTVLYRELSQLRQGFCSPMEELLIEQLLSLSSTHE
ncbi:dynamin family protein [Corynebacterium choanae]|uniref:Isoniazid-induced protein IniC n=1 Tax=Corynebacterium choanae TaxID=1862358 RepID=A0A3G6J583_9CORY|nr:dynamin family protein [Corynebacterium choanae]AZA13099.1 Isoniazid-induced protein IniC [Corynebacterium choanae]